MSDRVFGQVVGFEYSSAMGSASVSVYGDDEGAPRSEVVLSLSISDASFVAFLTPEQAGELIQALQVAAKVAKPFAG